MSNQLPNQQQLMNIIKPVPTQEQFNKITQFFFTFELLNKLAHWNTNSYALHKATDKFNESMQSIIDKFMEVFIGRYKLKPYVVKIELNEKHLTDDGIKAYFIKARDYIQGFEAITTDTELLNIRDELLASINQSLYLFELK